MADFFSRLAERALGVANVARPIRPSVYAPTPATLFVMERGTRSPGSLSSAEDVPNSAKDTFRLRNQSPSEMQGAGTSKQLSSRGVKSERPAGLRPGTPPDEALPFSSIEESGGRPLSGIVDEMAMERAGLHPMGLQSISEETQALIERAGAQLEVNPPVYPDDFQDVGPRRQADSPELPLIGSRPGSDLEYQAKNQRPVVKVKIGRVEVRAVMSPPAPSPTRAALPKLTSLEEYLKQREEARR